MPRRHLSLALVAILLLVSFGAGAPPARAAPPAPAYYAVTELAGPGGLPAFASGLNAVGQVVGAAYDPTGSGSPRAVRWDGGVATELAGPAPVVEGSVAAAINAAGAVVGGWWHLEQGGAFLYRDGVARDLGNPSGARARRRR